MSFSVEDHTCTWLEQYLLRSYQFINLTLIFNIIELSFMKQHLVITTISVTILTQRN